MTATPPDPSTASSPASSSTSPPGGPLQGMRVVELAAIGPVPHAAMLLADLGAQVVRVEGPRRGLQITGDRPDQLLRGRETVSADLKTPEGQQVLADLLADADILLEGLRPGVLERLGLAPDTLLERFPRLVVGRMTGWGQEGPRAQRAGHDINYLSLTGALHAIGRPGEPPVVPLNLVGDFGGGSMFLVVGVLAALWDRARTGRGQVVDTAMVDCVPVLAQMVWALRGVGMWSDERGANLLDGAAPFYDTYPCADGRYVAVGALEPQFYAELLAGLGLADAGLPAQYDRAGWPVLRERLAAAFAGHDRDHWDEVFRDRDACVTPVLSWDEATRDPHLVARGVFTERDGVVQPRPAPRFRRGPA